MHVQYGLHGTVVSVHLLYSTVPTMLTVSATLLYHMPVQAALYGSFRSPAGCTVAFVPCWYNDSTLPRSSHPSRCHVCLFGKLHIHHLLPQTSLFSFLSPSASLSTPVSLPLIPGEFVHCCLVVLVDCCCVACDFTMMNLVLAFFLLFVRHYCIVCTFSTGCMMRQFQCTHCTDCLYHAGTTIWRCPVCIHCSVTIVCFAISTFITSFLTLPFLPSFPSQLLVFHCLASSCSL